MGERERKKDNFARFAQRSEPKFEIQIDDVSAKAPGHNFLSSAFQSLEKIV